MAQPAPSTLDELNSQFEALRFSITQWRNAPDKKGTIPEVLKEKIGYLFAQGFSTSKLQSIGISYKQAKRWANQHHSIAQVTESEEKISFVPLLNAPVATNNEPVYTLLKVTLCKDALQATVECNFEQSIKLLKTLGL